MSFIGGSVSSSILEFKGDSLENETGDDAIKDKDNIEEEMGKNRECPSNDGDEMDKVDEVGERSSRIEQEGKDVSETMDVMLDVEETWRINRSDMDRLTISTGFCFQIFIYIFFFEYGFIYIFYLNRLSI